jgi:hypothetical protein
VSSQADTEAADLARETHELATQPEAEHAELTAIYVKRELDEPLAAQVATHGRVSSEHTHGQVQTEPMHDTCPTMFISNLFSWFPPSAFVNRQN